MIRTPSNLRQDSPVSPVGSSKKQEAHQHDCQKLPQKCCQARADRHVGNGKEKLEELEIGVGLSVLPLFSYLLLYFVLTAISVMFLLMK